MGIGGFFLLYEFKFFLLDSWLVLLNLIAFLINYSVIHDESFHCQSVLIL